jgi:predicted TIM-barrel fold metal-dependent hydrolase
VVIDANMYWFDEHIFEESQETERFLSEIPISYGIHGYMKENEDQFKQIVIEKPKGYQNLNYMEGDYLLEKQLADMDAGNVQKAILKLPGCHEWMSLDMCKKFNDGMADYVRKSQGRLVALAVVPPLASEACFQEIERCRNELGMSGVQLCAHYGNHYLDSDIFNDFFKKLNEQKTTVYIHHTPVPVQYDCLYDYNNLRRSYGRCVDQTTAICRELFSGFFDRFPNLTFVHSMLGGGFFAIENMLFPPHAKTTEKVARFESNQDNVWKVYKEHIYFETSHAQPWGKQQLECAIQVLGADHIIFGSSYPVRREWLLEGAEFIKMLDISNEEKDMILYKNACQIYHIDE